MRKITFYSYKGGTGRTLLLANLAKFLAAHNKRVAVLDLDLEAPGLNYKFGMNSAELKGHLTRGIADYILEFAQNRPPASIDSYCIPLTRNNRVSQFGADDSRIYLFPAGRGPSPEYASTLAKLNWHSMVYTISLEDIRSGTKVPVAFRLFDHLIEQIENEINPDFLLIDSRTGMTDVGSLALHRHSDAVVCLMLDNLENLEGTREVLLSLCGEDNDKAADIVPVLSRLLETERPGYEWSRLDSVARTLCLPSEGRSLGFRPSDIVILHSHEQIQKEETLWVDKDWSPNECLVLRDYYHLLCRLGLDAVLSSEEKNLILALCPMDWQKASAERLMRDRLARGNTNIWSNESGVDTEARICRRKGARREGTQSGLVYLLPSCLLPKSDLLLKFTRYMSYRLNHILENPTEWLQQPEAGFTERFNYTPIEKPFTRITLDHILGQRLHEGDIDFCAEPIPVTKSQSQTISCLQYGWLRTFTAVVRKDSYLVDEFAKHRAIHELFGNTTQDLELAFKKIGERREVAVGVLGETAAASEAIEVLPGLVRGLRFVTFHTESDILDWLYYDEITEVPGLYNDQSRRSAYLDAYRTGDRGPKTVSRIVLCDHAVALRLQQMLEQRDYRCEISMCNYEQNRGSLHFPFRNPIPIGFPYARGDSKWRRQIVRAFAASLIEQVEKAPWGTKCEPGTISQELNRIGIEAFEIEDLYQSLALDMSLDEAMKWLERATKVLSTGCRQKAI
jgi:hypothetical protein